MCEDCHTDSECGWNRTPVYHHLDTVSNEIHVAEYWADCAEGTGAHWEVQTRAIFEDIRANDLEEFINAGASVYLAQEGGHMEGKLVSSNKDFYNDGLETWVDEDQMMVEPGSTRLYVVIEAKDASKPIKVALRVLVTDPPDSVADCMDHRMCLSEMHLLRNDNQKQLQCLQDGCLNCDAALQDECSKWEACLNDNGVSKQRLQALLEASSIPTVVTQASEITGNCLQPANDDPESWECECAGDLDAVCPPTSTPDLAHCYLTHMCNYDDICQSWKDQKCQTILLSTHNVTVQGNMEVSKDMQGRRQTTGNTSSLGLVGLEDSLSGKACARSAR